jgi:hypothetical protein
LSNGEVVAPARAIELPTAFRVDFDAGPVWFAAAIPQPPSMEAVFIPGDEIMATPIRDSLRDGGNQIDCAEVADRHGRGKPSAGCCRCVIKEYQELPASRSANTSRAIR